MKKNQDIVRGIVSALITDQRLLVADGEITLDGESIDQQDDANAWDEHGFGSIKSEKGGRENLFFNTWLDAKIKSGDKIWAKVVDKTPRLIVINHGLTDEQYKDWHVNRTHYFMVSRVKSSVQQYVDDENKNVVGHLVATAGNSSDIDNKYYDDYLDGVVSSAKDWCQAMYNRLASSNTRRDR